MSEPWDYLFGDLKADVVLAQECTRLPKAISSSDALHRLIPGKAFGNCIYARGLGLREVPVDTRQVGSLLVGEVQAASGERLALVNIYGLLESAPGFPGFLVVHAGIHRALSDITLLLLGKTRPKHTNLILAGDFNNDRRMDDHPTFRVKGKRTANLLFDSAGGPQRILYVASSSRYTRS